MPLPFRVILHPEARSELDALPPRAQHAIDAAMEKLRIEGPTLRHPHQSNVRGARGWRELRPSAGRSAWRPLYRQVSASTFMIAAISPEAMRRPRQFRRAVRLAQRRLEEVT